MITRYVKVFLLGALTLFLFGCSLSRSLPKKNVVLSDLQRAFKEENYNEFGILLGKAYENDWMKEKEFGEIERDAYVFADKTYFTLGDFDKSLEVSSSVYNGAPLSGRFRYLLVLSLEALGKKAFQEDDLKKAEEYALRILQIGFRPEGMNLLGDVYIERVRGKLKSGDKEGARKDLIYIDAFEMSQDREEILKSLAREAGLMVKE